jgi:transposase
MVFSTTWLEFKDMTQDPLARREPVSAACNRRPDEGLETQKYSIYPKEHPASCPVRWRLSNGLGVYLSWLQAGFSHHTRQPNWWSVHQRRLAPVVVPHFDNHSLATRPVYMDDNARPHRSRAVTAYLQSETVTSVPWPAMSPDLNPIVHIWDMLGRRIYAREPPVQNIVSGMAAAITTGHPTSNWRDETQDWCRHPSTWRLHPVLNFEQ